MHTSETRLIAKQFMLCFKLAGITCQYLTHNDVIEDFVQFLC